MKIRKATPADLPQILDIYTAARKMMQDSGNPNQWGNTNPPQAMVENDIATSKSYVCTNGAEREELLAVFFFEISPDPTYTKINGSWKNNEPYGVIHRIARATTPSAKGAGAFCIDWCFAQCKNIRIDTHRDNVPMLKLLDKLGFHYCGVIWLENGDERLAYQKHT